MQTIHSTGKKYSKLRAKLRGLNQRFRAKSRRDQRIAIATDVIDLLAADKIVADSTYLTMPTVGYWEEHTPGFESAAAKGVDAGVCFEQVKCEVCGIGSLFLSAVRNNDKLPSSDLKQAIDDGDIRELQVDYLSKWFDDAQLDAVEAHYERRGDAVYGSPILDEEDSNKRLKMIMQNIISNRGKFDPHKGAHAVESSE